MTVSPTATGAVGASGQPAHLIWQAVAVIALSLVVHRDPSCQVTVHVFNVLVHTAMPVCVWLQDPTRHTREAPMFEKTAER